MQSNGNVASLALANGEVLTFREAGQGNKAVVLLHGNMSSSAHYDLLLENLADDYKLYAFDLRGFGDSSYNTAITSLQDLAHDIAEATNCLGLSSFAVVGWSTGGGVALELSALYPQIVEKIVLIDSVGVKGYPMYRKDAFGQPILREQLKTKEEVANDAVQVLPILQAYSTKNRAFLRFVWDTLIYTRNKPEAERYERYIDGMLKQRNLVDIDYALVTFNMTDTDNGVVKGSNRLRQIMSPVLLVHGEDDLVVPVTESMATAKMLGELATLIVLPECGHSPLTDNLPGLEAALRSFLG